MDRPKIEKVYELAMMFQAVAEASDNKAPVDMGNWMVPVGDDANICNTPACHAGWFGVLKDPGRKRDSSYSYYAEQMAKFLGFPHGHSLELWAHHHPEIWGNPAGYEMFSSNRAFGLPEGKKITMKHIAEHWHKVGKRLELLVTIEKRREEVEEEIKRELASV